MLPCPYETVIIKYEDGKEEKKLVGFTVKVAAGSTAGNVGNFQHKRFAVPPGITGWWQISGRSDKPMHLHTEDDLYYISHYSPLLDLQILWRTIGVVFKGKGAY